MSVLRTKSAGTVIVTARIVNGLGGNDYVEDFNIAIKAAESPMEPIFVRLPDYSAFRPFTYIKVKES